MAAFEMDVALKEISVRVRNKQRDAIRQLEQKGLVEVEKSSPAVNALFRYSKENFGVVMEDRGDKLLFAFDRSAK